MLVTTMLLPVATTALALLQAAMMRTLATSIRLPDAMMALAAIRVAPMQPH
jgi:hypothetical protein